jgi:hypothetical protein
MASYHLSVKIGKNSSGAKHAAYISREGKYADKEDCEAVLNENMPDWAKEPNDFWQAADQYERANGSIYREFEISLPRELTPEQRLKLVKEFTKIELGNKFTYTAAIHNPKAAIEGGEQPHAHIMYSERTLDGIERPAEQHFKRYNAKNPERGGCQKANTAKTKDERKTELVALRERWAKLQNKHLAAAGMPGRVTHRSLAAQGIARLPEAHIGPKRRDLFALVKASRDAEKEVMMKAKVQRALTEEMGIFELIGFINTFTDEEHALYRAMTKERNAAQAPAPAPKTIAVEPPPKPKPAPEVQEDPIYAIEDVYLSAMYEVSHSLQDRGKSTDFVRAALEKNFNFSLTEESLTTLYYRLEGDKFESAIDRGDALRRNPKTPEQAAAASRAAELSSRAAVIGRSR